VIFLLPQVFLLTFLLKAFLQQERKLWRFANIGSENYAVTQWPIRRLGQSIIVKREYFVRVITYVVWNIVLAGAPAAVALAGAPAAVALAGAPAAVALAGAPAAVALAGMAPPIAVGCEPGGGGAGPNGGGRTTPGMICAMARCCCNSMMLGQIANSSIAPILKTMPKEARDIIPQYREC
jgi:hypothetical protein